VRHRLLLDPINSHLLLILRFQSFSGASGAREVGTALSLRDEPPSPRCKCRKLFGGTAGTGGGAGTGGTAGTGGSATSTVTGVVYARDIAENPVANATVSVVGT